MLRERLSDEIETDELVIPRPYRNNSMNIGNVCLYFKSFPSPLSPILTAIKKTLNQKHKQRDKKTKSHKKREKQAE